MPTGESRIAATSSSTTTAGGASSSPSSTHPQAPQQQDSSSSALSHASYLSALRQIDSIPVHDLASTLTNPASATELDDGDSFLRSTQVDAQNEWRAANASASERLRALQEQLRSLEEATHRSDTPYAPQTSRNMSGLSRSNSLGRDDAARRERLQRVLSRLNRLHGSTAAGSYGETAPSHNSLYDWSPPSLAELEDANEEAEMETIRRELRRQMPNHHPEVLRAMAENVRADMERERQRSRTTQSARFLSSHENPPPRAETSLRSQAILQAVRRHPRFSARSREYMQRYIADRAERGLSTTTTTAITSSESRERFSPTSERYPWSRRSAHDSSTTSDDSRSRLRRSVLQDPPSSSSDASSDHLKRAVVYLGNLRRSQSYEDSLGYAVDARFVTKEFFGDRHDDFVLDIYSLAPTTSTSILARGTKFKGCQRANPDLTPTQNRSRRRWERELGGWDTLRSGSSQEYLPRLTLDDPTRPSSANVPPHAQRAASSTKYYTPDQWPVEVTIHEVDWQHMTLSATMEAQDVPSHTPLMLDSRTDATPRRSGSFDSLPDLINPDGSIYVEPRRSETPQLPPLADIAASLEAKPDTQPLKTITTYLEGEILDFRTHSFLTENFPSTPANDATYWRKLEPFRDFTETELLRCLLSREFLNGLNEKYILMRWKERCFVDDPKATHSSEIRGVQTPTTAIHLTSTTSRPGESYEMAEGCGLTISGFYYVCLRRSDGRIEGLYCDPQSSPYQHLMLERSKNESWWWGWEFK